ncbi:tRNA 2-selenouridine(34) synthase MnmH [Rhodobacter xanthinilyticus]|uniref:tRNA 2-selenouridine(34) synthase MnmH n=1 Tax=Rhodobacter xanthinilyticus TaxID=1850250 RepID=A0A1D9MEP6_9RHOB|nr:tRNA 2-selenouridine(34) synthase MnmH [Rhodobacter xanthinilyticus]AOZ70219.1 tRNA 2-selenouridine(34) synthase MnmH [Rhodobacter xanthinilyticus]
MRLSTVDEPLGAGFDTIIDVRAPSEFAEDHLPGAINLPVLDDAERARVGTIYKQVSPFDARKIGAALVAKNAARHIEGPLAAMPGGWRPLVYCWRGGQRSGSFATILRQIGWRVELVEGGYKAWRGLVVAAVAAPVVPRVVVLDGNTGSAKTEILLAAQGLGAQVLDLEGLANHRGSIFGARPGGQPSQKAFERELALALGGFDPGRPVLVEAESSKIGAINLPKGIWAAICAAPRVQIAAPLAARAEYLARAYGDVAGDRAELARLIDKLRPFQPAEAVERWLGWGAAGALTPLAGELMALHYDPRYAKHRARHGGAAVEIAAPSLAPEAVAGLARAVIAAAERLVS